MAKRLAGAMGRSSPCASPRALLLSCPFVSRPVTSLSVRRISSFATGKRTLSQAGMGKPRALFMLSKPAADILASEITPRSAYLRRREFLAGAAALGFGSLLPPAARAAPLQADKSPLSSAGEPQTPLKDIISYNNFYEFGVDKDDPVKNAHTLKTKPWKVKVDGLVNKPAEYELDDLIKDIALEERIYRRRGVGGGGMGIPWVGVPLASPPKRPEPQGSAKYGAFDTLVR